MTRRRNRASGGGGGGGDRREPQGLVTSDQSVQTCCLLCHRERKDWGTAPSGGTVPPEGKLPLDFVPTLAQNLLGEMPLWICQSCRKSVEEEERRAVQEQALAVSLSHMACQSQSCGGSPHSSSSSSSSSSSCHGHSGDWDPSSFLSAHKLSGLWTSPHGSETVQGNSLGVLAAPVTPGDKYFSIAPSSDCGENAPKVCPYSHSSSPAVPGIPLPTSLDFCKTTSKQFSNMCCKPLAPGELFHSSEHHQQSELSAPPNSPTDLSSQPSLLAAHQQSQAQEQMVSFPAPTENPHASVPKISAGSPAAIHKAGTGVCKNSHLNTPLGKVTPPALPPSVCNHPCSGHCATSVMPQGGAHVVSCNKEAACKTHTLPSGPDCQQPESCEADEGLGEDEDSSSERSSCTSSSANQKDGKFCDCCYCEFFGHNAPPAAPTSRNYAEIREKLRSRLTKRKEELPEKLGHGHGSSGEPAVDHRDVDQLLDYINSTEPKAVNSARAAKRARHKQKRKEKEKAQLEAEMQRRAECSSSVGEDMEVQMEDKLQWPQLELDRVNSFLSSRLEEIKNTIKDSIRASFSVCDLNLDVNDFPKKAAVLEQKNRHTHLNGSSDLQEIDLDLSPLTLGSSDNDTLNRDESEVRKAEADGPVTENGVVKRLSAVPNLSRMIWVQSQKQADCVQNSQEVAPGEGSKLWDPTPAAGQQKKNKKQNCTARKSEAKKLLRCLAKAHNLPPEPVSKMQTAKNCPEMDQSQEGSARPETELSGERKEQVHWEAVTAPAGGAEWSHVPRRVPGGSPQLKSKSRKSRKKTQKCNSSIDDVFLPKDVDGTEMDETDREVEYFKRFCLDSAKQTRQKVAVNWTNFSMKKTTSNAAP